MKRDVNVLMINSGVWCFKDSVGEIEEVLREVGVEEFIGEDGKKYSFDDGIKELCEYGSIGEMLVLKNLELCERGDDYCEMSIVIGSYRDNELVN